MGRLVSSIEVLAEKRRLPLFQSRFGCLGQEYEVIGALEVNPSEPGRNLRGFNGRMLH